MLLFAFKKAFVHRNKKKMLPWATFFTVDVCFYFQPKGGSCLFFSKWVENRHLAGNATFQIATIEGEMQLNTDVGYCALSSELSMW